MPHDLNVTLVYISVSVFEKYIEFLSLLISVHGNKISDRLLVLYWQNKSEYRISVKSAIGPALVILYIVIHNIHNNLLEILSVHITFII